MPAASSLAAAHLETLGLAKLLVAQPSLTPDDAGCLDLVARRLAQAGFQCERLDRNGVGNLWARRGTDRPLVCFAGHVDVVPAGPVAQWTSDPFVPTERDGYLCGRGVADMKVSIAAMVTAVERFVAGHPDHPGSIALLLTSDEEGAATDGTAAVVEALRARGERIDACVVGEPTSVSRLGDTVKHGRRGSLNGRLIVKGVQCHIAYPERGRNPIHALAPALAELVTAEWDRGNADFPPTAFQVSAVAAGAGAVNIIPGSLDLHFNFRFSPEATAEGLRARVHQILDRHGVDYELAWSLSAAPFSTPRGPLVNTLAAAIGVVTGVTPELSTSGGTSDGRFLASIAGEVVEFGPLNDTIHQIDERVSLADLGPLSSIYERTLSGLLLSKA
jgi:succinyl-diaminopimelate desuccinylase